MDETKSAIIKNICYTELVYGRINKKLGTNLTNEQIEELVLRILEETQEKFYSRSGKNYYITNTDQGIRLTINSNNFRIITVDRM